MTSPTPAVTAGADAEPGDASHGSRSRNPLTRLLVALVDLYRLTAPVRQPRCRFHPSCSTYARQALGAHGPVRGLVLTARRLLRCHPWNPGGVDHVPPRTPRFPEGLHR